jgi:hypothetical protein
MHAARRVIDAGRKVARLESELAEARRMQRLELQRLERMMKRADRLHVGTLKLAHVG